VCPVVCVEVVVSGTVCGLGGGVVGSVCASEEWGAADLFSICNAKISHFIHRAGNEEGKDKK
jgi:hypothetical protein